jgi:undecaprenyl-diphosphatase
MSIIEAIVLGVVQGLTEFLPVSSSGHIELGKAVLGVELVDAMLFSVVVHAATALSTIIAYWKEIGSLFKGIFKFQWNEETQFAAKILLSMIPVGIVGFLLKDFVEAFFEGNLALVGAALLVTGALLLLTKFLEKPIGEGGGVTYGKAFIIGIAQAIAVIPGISRSGSTIATALILGVSREKAARFSFLMVLPPIVGANLVELLDYQPSAATDISAGVLIAGFIAAFVTGLAACLWMIKLVKKGQLTAFAVYCFIVGAIAIGYSLVS